MTTLQIDHEAVGAYVLGALTPEESDEFEAHLAQCETCASELDQLLPVSQALSLANAEALLAAAERPEPSAPMLDRLLDNVSQQRRGARRRWLFALAAGLVLIALAAVGGVLAGTGLDSDDSNPQTPPAVALTGQRFSATSEAGVKAVAGVEKKTWGTQIGLQLENIHGPLTCQMVAVGKDGSVETAMTWTVPRQGYGTPEQPKALLLQGGIAMDSSEIARLDVQILDDEIPIDTLVQIPVSA